MSEFLNLRIRAVEHTPYGWKLHVNGKTGRRPIMLVNSGPYLQTPPYRWSPPCERRGSRGLNGFSA